jgi:putative ABC transport system permease protein
MTAWRLAWRLLRRDLAAGEVRVLIAALILAVTAVTSVSFLTDRAGRALSLEANRLLGGDAVLRGDEPLGDAPLARARAEQLQTAETLSFRSMVRAGTIGPGYPLRGRYSLVDNGANATTTPAPGTIWLSRDGAQRLGAKVGDSVKLGDSTLTVGALVAQEPDAAADFFNVAPRVFIAMSDLAATGLMQEGSRATWRLAVAGDAAAVSRFTEAMRASLARGQRIETVSDARPEVRTALDRADRFLGLTALIAVMLSAVAIAMAARRHARRHVETSAMLRCLGAVQSTIVAIYGIELMLIGVSAAALGTAIAWLLQALLGTWLAEAMAITIPPASAWPALQGFAVGLAVLLAFALPPVLALRRVPALRVLRRELRVGEPSAWVVAIVGLVAVLALLWWKAGSATMAGIVLGGIGATLLALGALAGLLVLAVRALRGRLRGPWRYGLANVTRRAGATIAQTSALGLGLMAILLLTLVRTDLMSQWRRALPADAPNRFIINVQSDQADGVRALLRERDIAAPQLYPMIRGRLVSVNDKAISGDSFSGDDDRSRRLAEREFNLSWAESFRATDNKLVAGQYWSGAPATPELSIDITMRDALASHSARRSRACARFRGTASSRISSWSRRRARSTTTRRAGSRRCMCRMVMSR